MYPFFRGGWLGMIDKIDRHKEPKAACSLKVWLVSSIEPQVSALHSHISRPIPRSKFVRPWRSVSLWPCSHQRCWWWFLYGKEWKWHQWSPVAGQLENMGDLRLWFTLQGTNISPKNGILKMIFLFPRWDMLIFLEGIMFIGFPIWQQFSISQVQRLPPDPCRWSSWSRNWARPMGLEVPHGIVSVFPMLTREMGKMMMMMMMMMTGCALVW